MKVNTEKVSFVEPLALECGEVLHGFDLMTETYGELNYAKFSEVSIYVDQRKKKIHNT